ncbi:hypothetical protein [Streptomyces ipomoeae]|uniref:hypothetical protein n=1 Tax=Streptomyces ipomoeae TaxID=103232 RepID=UPI001146886A|nr:hypothetical protein [Streptomyces ipomoeae]TQE35445.1 hypothetical protein Sipo7851_14380 [Streptomyces ipomoeae]
MSTVQDSYLGWEQLTHAKACKRPVWEVDLRRREDAWRYKASLAYEERAEHKCADEFCSHGNRFDELTVRIVCRSCGMAEVITGERNEDTGRTSTSTRWLGYGLPPRRIAGLLLWPGEPWLNVGRAETDEPHDFLVTRSGVERVIKEAVAGQIAQTRGKRGGVIWTGCAVPSEDGPYGVGLGRIRWARVQEGFKTPAAAAKWIAVQLAEAGAGGGAE